ncbi:MAG: hypothetical protein R3B07_03390 [Polyangiaceae bacterium]
MCFSAKYSPEALASQSSELLQSSVRQWAAATICLACKASRCPIRIGGAHCSQSASLGRDMALMARGAHQPPELTLPATQLASRGTLDSTIIRSCGSWTACGYFVRHWYSRLSSGLVTPLTAAACRDASERPVCGCCFQGSRAEPSHWYQCIDASRPFFFDVRKLGDEA